MIDDKITEDYLKLAEIAVANGFSQKEMQKYVSYSPNDLIVDWEVGETSFISALIKASKGNYNISDYLQSIIDLGFTIKEAFIINWTLCPKSGRLDLLFDTFSNLLTQE